MHIVHIIAPGGLNGAERLVLHGVKALMELGVKITLFAIHETRAQAAQLAFFDHARSLGVPVEPLYCEHQLEMGLLLKLRQALKRLPMLDLVHAHGFKALFYATWAVPVTTPLVCTHHGDSSHDQLASGYEALAKGLYTRCKRVFAVSAQTQHTLQRSCPVIAERVVVVDNFLTRDSVNLAPSPPKAPDAPLRLLFVGRLSLEKNLWGLMAALAAQPAHLPVVLDVLGDGPLRALLHQHIQALPAHIQVNLHGFVHTLEPWLQGADAMILPSLREGMPLVVIEALCAGLPVLATPVGALPSMLRGGEHGILSRSCAASDLAQMIWQARAALPKLRAAALDVAPMWRSRMSASRWAEQTFEHYLALCPGLELPYAAAGGLR